MPEYSISPAVREILEESFIEERDLIDSLRSGRVEEDPGSPGAYRSSFLMTVRRPMDLETAELRKVQVELRERGGSFEVVSVTGLDPK